MDWKVPLTDVTLDEQEAQAAAGVIRSGWLTQGEKVQAFEQAFAEAVGSRHAIAVTNGTAALHLAYLIAGLGPEDEFIVPALTFVATMNAGLYLGAKPVLADCASLDDLTISPEDIERKITPRTRLIVTMPYGGFCPDMPAIQAIADKHNIPIVEDACHAPLAELDGRKMGIWGVAGTFSFFSNKNLATGEGGMIVTDDDTAAERLRILRSHGITSPTHERHLNRSTTYDVAEPGYNYRLDEIRAAIGHIQLEKLPEATEKRRAAATKLRAAIESLNIDGLTIPFANPRGLPVHHLFVILLPPGTSREDFRSQLAAKGVQTSMHYPLLHHFQATQTLFPIPPELPIADEIARRLVTLPMGPHIDDDAIAIITQAIGDALKWRKKTPA